MSPTTVTRHDNPLRDPRDRRLARIAGPCGLVIFGVTGDLAQKKLLPAVYDLAHRGLLAPGFALIGFGRRDWDDEQFAAVVREAVEKHSRTTFSEDTWRQLRGGIRFVSGSFDDPGAFDHLQRVCQELTVRRGTRGNYAFYLSVPPAAFPEVCGQLERSGLSTPPPGSWRRVVIEKPFGHDLGSARELNRVVERVFTPDSVFRIDHYLGKETVQNILAFRFSNQLFEPLWNSRYVDHVQITMAEDIGVGGRAGYYDGIGAARDVIQNHLLQLLALTAMEEPVSFSAADLATEKIKVLSAATVADDYDLYTARGQYRSGWQGGENVVGYLDEGGFDPQSRTETYAAMRIDINNRRWAGVPFYLRTGKRVARRVTEIAVIFKKAPPLPFSTAGGHEPRKNALVFRVQPDEGASLRFNAKVPGTTMEVRDVTMDFGYGHSFTEASPEAYERLILDVLLGDPPLFPRHREVELSWAILDPVLEHWAREGSPESYRAGTWGPQSADRVLAADGRKWRRP